MFKTYINGNEVSRKVMRDRKIVEQNRFKFTKLLLIGYLKKTLRSTLDKLWGIVSSNRKTLLIGAITVLLVLFGWAKIYAYTDDVTAFGGKKIVTVHDDQVREMISRGYSKTKIINLLTFRTLECNRYDGMCYGLGKQDLGFFQINYIHKVAYRDSLSLMKQGKSGELFLYQLDFVSDMYDRLDRDYCNSYNHYLAGMKFTNRSHFRCLAYSYNGSPRYKKAYDIVGWLKRTVVKKYLKENFTYFK